MATKTKLIDIPNRVIPIGPDSVKSPNTINANARVLLFTLNQVGWPLTGGRAFRYELRSTLNNWVSSTLISESDVDDVPQGGAHGIPAGQFSFGGIIPDVGDPNRRVGIFTTGDKAVTVNGELSVST